MHSWVTQPVKKSENDHIKSQNQPGNPKNRLLRMNLVLPLIHPFIKSVSLKGIAEKKKALSKNLLPI
jgi:hypothetical protein